MMGVTDISGAARTYCCGVRWTTVHAAPAWSMQPHGCGVAWAMLCLLTNVANSCSYLDSLGVGPMLYV